MTLVTVMDGDWADRTTLACDGCTLAVTVYGATATSAELEREAEYQAVGAGITECPMVPGTHWCAACEGPRRAAAAEAVPF